MKSEMIWVLFNQVVADCCWLLSTYDFMTCYDLFWMYTCIFVIYWNL